MLSAYYFRDVVSRLLPVLFGIFFFLYNKRLLRPYKRRRKKKSFHPLVGSECQIPVELNTEYFRSGRGHYTYVSSLMQHRWTRLYVKFGSHELYHIFLLFKSELLFEM